MHFVRAIIDSGSTLVAIPKRKQCIICNPQSPMYLNCPIDYFHQDVRDKEFDGGNILPNSSGTEPRWAWEELGRVENSVTGPPGCVDPNHRHRASPWERKNQCRPTLGHGQPHSPSRPTAARTERRARRVSVRQVRGQVAKWDAWTLDPLARSRGCALPDARKSGKYIK